MNSDRNNSLNAMSGLQYGFIHPLAVDLKLETCITKATDPFQSTNQKVKLTQTTDLKITNTIFI